MFEVKSLGYSYPGSDAEALQQLSFAITPGEFLLIMGRSGSGKSTLARALCRVIPDFYGGKMSGQVIYENCDLREWDPRQLSAQIAILFQEAGRQIVYNQVERDIAFGLENLGMPPSLMKRRVAEALDFFDLNSIKHKSPSELSGGEQRRVALAGVLVMQPRVLILDEPSSQLDPLAAEELLNWLKKLNAEMGTTIILVEQKLDKAFPLIDRVLMLEAGQLIYDGLPSRQPVWARQADYPLIPTVPYIMADMDCSDLPVTVKEARGIIKAWLEPSAGICAPAGAADLSSQELTVPASGSRPVRLPVIHAIRNADQPPKESSQPLLHIKGLDFGYSRRSRFIEDLNFRVNRGESVVILGANGAGKSTLLRLITGILKPQRGTIKINGEESAKDRVLASCCAYLPQSVEDFFLRDTVLDEIILSMGRRPANDAGPWLRMMGLEGMEQCDPRKLSAGEKQRVALACLLASDRELLLLDEPTTGVDIEWKGKISDCLSRSCREQGKTMITITHDMEFASETASRVVFMHGGELLSDQPASEAFTDNLFYASQAVHLFKGYDNTIFKPSQARQAVTNLLKREDGSLAVKV